MIHVCDFARLPPRGALRANVGGKYERKLKTRNANVEILNKFEMRSENVQNRYIAWIEYATCPPVLNL
jgi:hypothetical protein